MKVLSFFIGFTFLLSACRKDAPIKPSLFDGGRAIILGEWEWIRTEVYDCSSGWDTLSPENTGDHYSFFLTADTQVVFYQNEVILAQYPLHYRIIEIQQSGYVPALRQVVLEMTYVENDSIRDYWVDGRLGKAACRAFPYTSQYCLYRYNLFRKVGI